MRVLVVTVYDPALVGEVVFDGPLADAPRRLRAGSYPAVAFGDDGLTSGRVTIHPSTAVRFTKEP